MFFEPFDAEKYSIHYTDGTTEPLTSDRVTITNGNDIVLPDYLRQVVMQQLM